MKFEVFRSRLSAIGGVKNEMVPAAFNGDLDEREIILIVVDVKERAFRTRRFWHIKELSTEDLCLLLNRSGEVLERWTLGMERGRASGMGGG
jgi:hypothetical protein